MAPGWPRHLRPLVRVLAVSLALTLTLGAGQARPEVVVILGRPAGADARVESTRVPSILVSSDEAPHRRIAATRASEAAPALHAPYSGRAVRLPPPGPHPARPRTPVYLAYLRILC